MSRARPNHPAARSILMTAPKLAAGITRAGEGEGGVAWNILGQT
jgi:hypothetical protein